MQQIFFFFLEEDQSIKSGSKKERKREKQRGQIREQLYIMRVNRKFIRRSRGELAKEKNILLCKKKKKKNRRLIDEEEEEVPFWDTVCGCYAFSNARFELSYETVLYICIYIDLQGRRGRRRNKNEEGWQREKQDNDGCCRYAQERDFFIIPKR